MKQLILIKIKTKNGIASEKEGDDKTKQLLEKLGIKASVIKKIDAGELSVDDAAKEYEAGFEQAITKRIQADVEKVKTKEIFASVYTKFEKTICSTFGLEHENYAAVEEKDRTKTMLSDAKKATDLKLENMKSTFTGADSDKIKILEKKYQEQIDSANSEKAAAILKAEQVEKDSNLMLKAFKNELALKEVQSKFLQGIKNPSLEQKHMEIILKSAIREAEIGLDTEDDQGRVFVTDKEGKRLKSKKSVSENMTLEEFLSATSEEQGFEKKSNGVAAGVITVIGKTDAAKTDHKGVSPRAIELMEKKGIIPKS